LENPSCTVCGSLGVANLSSCAIERIHPSSRLRDLRCGRLHRVEQTLVVGGAHHVAVGGVWTLVDAQPLERDADDLALGKHGPLAEWLHPRLVVDVAVRVLLDLIEPLDVDVRPASGDGVRASCARPAGGGEIFVVDLDRTCERVYKWMLGGVCSQVLRWPMRAWVRWFAAIESHRGSLPEVESSRSPLRREACRP